MNPSREILLSGSIAIRGQEIVDVGSTTALRARWPGAEELDASGCVVTPGFVNAHQHIAGGPLNRSCTPDNLEPGAAIFQWSVPLHQAATPEGEEVSALVACVESARNGVTTIVDPGTTSHPDGVAAGVSAVGLRAIVGIWGWDIEHGPLTGPADEVLQRQAEVLDRFPAGGLVSAWVTLVGHSLASDELLGGAAELARAREVGLTMHMSPTRSDPEAYLARTSRRPMVHLDSLGVLGPNVLLAHAVWIDDAELDALLASRTAVAYCPWAYLRHGQGVTANGRHAEAVVRGGRVALGCDAFNASDGADVLLAAALAAGLAKDMREDATWFGAHEALEMATIGGAEAIGLGAQIGSLEVGKQADIVIHDATRPQWSPRGDIVLQLVWAAQGRTVRDVYVAGRAVVRDGRCVNVDEEEVRLRAQLTAADLFERAGLTVPHRWPHVPSS